MNSIIDWPPPFTLQPSLRARAVRLQICARKGLRLIVPSGFNPKKALDVLHKHRGWIERTWLRVQPLLMTESEALPQQLHLRALGEVWQVDYEPRNIASVRIKVSETETLLSVSGQVQDQAKVKQALRKWLHSHAQDYLFPWLEGLSKETGLNYTQAKIRNTHTRWGSCSIKKNISLSCKLLFVQPLLVEHVLLHELCHTVHFNHAKPFWDLLKSFSPDTDFLRKELKKASRVMPLWLES